MDSIQQLQEILKPFENKIQLVNQALVTNANDEKALARLERIKTTYIIMLLKAFKDSPIEIQINKKDDKNIKYTIFWVDRRKYFKTFKNELLEFFSSFIRIVHSNDKLTLVDLKITGNRRLVLLIERNE